jgi:electron transfer flavoprotein beta subunit
MTVGVCLKWVDLRPEVDRLSGAVYHDARSTGLSDADQAALEWALRAGEAWAEPVIAVTAGPAGADGMLRDALAAGASSVVRIDLDAALPSAAVAAAIVPHLRGCNVIVCGDLSVDRGSGSVPAFLAAHLGAAQALGLVAVELGAAGTVRALRRLDGGRRERLLVPAPAVCSVEGSTARLRRAALHAVLAARRAAVPVHPGPSGPGANGHHAARPYRPRARALPPPHGDALDRVRQLTTGASHTTHGQPEVLEPVAAAARLFDAIAAWRPGPPAQKQG